MHRIFSFVVLLIAAALLSSCDSTQKASPAKTVAPTVITVYSGITMVKPLEVLIQQFEAQNPNIKFKLYQGASGYMLKTIQKDKSGDIFFPGSDSYRKKVMGENLLKDYVLVGFNRVALIVPKGNPKHLTSDLNQLTNPDLSVVLSTPNSGSIGKMTKKILDKANMTEEVYNNVTYFTTDSHRLFDAIRKQDADLTLNWYATAKWPESREILSALPLDEKIAKPKRLELNLLTFSKHPEITKKFMAYCASKTGIQVFYDYGFYSKSEYHTAIENLTGANHAQ